MIKTHLIQIFVWAIVLTSCSSKATKQKLIGKWQYAIDEMMAKTTKKLSNKEKAIYRSGLSGGYIQFGENNQALAMSRQGINPMTWVLSEDGKSLTLINTGGFNKGEQKFTILKMTSSRMELKVHKKDDDDVFEKLILKKKD